MYFVKEIFYTIQGEGANTGRPAVFCRFTGCNLWSGREEDRSEAACKFCDTDFVGINGTGGGKFESVDLAKYARSLFPGSNAFIVCTGGEPLLQLDSELVNALHDEGFTIAVETNGSIRPPPNIDWICVSPKSGVDIVVKEGNELKFIFPQVNANPSDYENLSFDHFFIQPMDNMITKQNTDLAIKYCLDNPKWKLSTQIHKLHGIR